MSGHVGDLSIRQQQALHEFREIVKDLALPDDDGYYLLRWLRARNFDLKKSEAMLRNHVAWRKNLDVDSIKDWQSPDVLQKYFVGGWTGFDKDGCPVWVDPFGQIDIKGILRSATQLEIIKYKVQLLEEVFNHTFHEQSAKMNKRVDQIVIVYDMGKLGWHHLWKPGVDAYLGLVTMFEDHYPETLKYTFVVNAPRLFPIAFNIVKPFLSEATAKKVFIFGSNYKESLLKYIDADQIPQYYGGTQTDPDGDPKCKTKVLQGGEVPKEYYRSMDSSELENLTQATISRGSSLQIDCDVTVPNSAIRWQFSTEGYDLGFGVYKRTKESRQKASEMEEIVPSRRVNCHLVPEDGSIACGHIGKYIIRFDNTYSWTKSKKVYYSIEVLEPDTEDFPNPSPSSCRASFESCKEI